MVLPSKQITEAPNPRPDQPFIEKVYSYLERRRPLATDIYVIGCEYVPIGLSIGISVRDGQAYDQVVNDVREAVKRYLWSLAPHGPNAAGWPLGKPVTDRELEVAVARVAGVNGVDGINIFKRLESGWEKLARAQACDGVELPLEDWQLPELLAIVVSTDGTVNDDLRALPDPISGGAGSTGGVAVPIIPEVC
jgi:hypothetical protein